MAIPDNTVKGLQEAFFLFDYDKDGKIASSEMGVIMRSVGLNPTELQLKEMISEVNSKGGLIDLKGLCSVISSGSRYKAMITTPEELTDSFNVFDKQGNGTLTLGDVRHGLSTLGEVLTNEEIDGLFRDVDPNGEGVCNINDLVKILMK